MKRFSIFLLLAIVIVLGLLIYKASVKEDDQKLAGLIKVRVQLQWLDGAQFAGLYIAKHKGYFEAEGLDVELISGHYNIDPFSVISRNDADIAMATGDRVLIQSAEKKDIKAFGTVYNQSIACFMGMAGKIKGLDDFRGKKIGVYRNYDTENILLSILKLHNIGNHEVEIVDAGLLEAFTKGEIDIFPSYRINEPITMELQNTKVDLFKPENYGVTFYSDTYFSSIDYWKKNKVVIQKFLSASAKGWTDAKADPVEAVKIMIAVTKTMTTNENKIKEEMALREAIKYLGDGNDHKINQMSMEKWEKMEEHLVSIGKIRQSGNIKDLVDFTLVK